MSLENVFLKIHKTFYQDAARPGNPQINNNDHPKRNIQKSLI